MRIATILLFAIALSNLFHDSSEAAFVQPQIIGGSTSVSDPDASMKHIEVELVGTSIQLTVDETVPTPVLRALEDPDEFDPAQPWAVLQDKAHNFQYGWLIGGLWGPPAGSGVWVELLDTTTGLETYSSRVPLTGTYDPIFGTDSSASIWQWDGAMTHNAYAVFNPTESTYEATYRVYIGNAATGVPTPGYQSSDVTLTFDATPMLTADFNGDTFVDGVDLNTWESSYGATSGVTQSMGDANSDGYIDGVDFLRWQKQYTGSAPTISAVPEPGAVCTALIVVALSSCCRSCARGSLERLRR